MRRFRLQFSLLTAFLLTTIAAMAIVIALQWREVGPLRSEVRRLRDEVGELAVDDPSKLHAIQVRQTNELVWKWRLWIPKGRTYLLRSYGDNVPKTGFPDDGGTMWIREPGEMWVEYRIIKDPRSGAWRGSMATQSGSVGSREQPWVEWQRRAGTGEGVGTSTQVAEADATLILARKALRPGGQELRRHPGPSAGLHDLAGTGEIEAEMGAPACIAIFKSQRPSRDRRLAYGEDQLCATNFSGHAQIHLLVASVRELIAQTERPITASIYDLAPLRSVSKYPTQGVTCPMFLPRIRLFRTIRCTIPLLLSILLTHIVQADTELRPEPKVTASPNGRYYFKLVPDADDREAGGHGFMYRVRREQDEIVYSTEGWYSDKVFVSPDGRYLCRIGNDGRHKKERKVGLVANPPARHIAIAFYEKGKPTKSYTVSKLIPDPDKLRRSFSHYQFFVETSFHTESLSPQQSEEIGGSSHGYWIIADAVDGELHVFDMRTGEKVGGADLKKAFEMQDGKAMKLAMDYMEQQGLGGGLIRTCARSGYFQFEIEYDKDSTIHKLTVDRRTGAVSMVN